MATRQTKTEAAAEATAHEAQAYRPALDPEFKALAEETAREVVTYDARQCQPGDVLAGEVVRTETFPTDYGLVRAVILRTSADESKPYVRFAFMGSVLATAWAQNEPLRGDKVAARYLGKVAVTDDDGNPVANKDGTPQEYANWNVIVVSSETL